MIITDQCNQCRLDEIQVTVIYSCAILIAVICKTLTGTLANIANPDQTPQNAASDQGLHCLLILKEVKG